MAKVKVQWTIEVTETYEDEIDWEDFAALFDGEPPTLEQFLAGEVDKSDVDAEELAGSEEGENRKYVSVDERYIDSIEVITPVKENDDAR